MSPSRRTFLKSSAALAAAGVVSCHVSAREDAPHFAVTAPLSQFEYDEVILLDGPVREQFDRNHAFYRDINEDSLLKPYRQRAGLPAPG